MNIDPKFVEFTADVFRKKYLINSVVLFSVRRFTVLSMSVWHMYSE